MKGSCQKGSEDGGGIGIRRPHDLFILLGGTRYFSDGKLFIIFLNLA